MALLHVNIFYQCLVDCLFNVINVTSWSKTSNYWYPVSMTWNIATLDYVLFYFHYFHCIIITMNHWYLLHSSVLHTFPTLGPYGYNVILSKVCNLLSSLLLSATLLISSVYTLCVFLLGLCCGFKMISSFNKQFL